MQFILLTNRFLSDIIQTTNAATERSSAEIRFQRVRVWCEPHIRVCVNNTPEQQTERVLFQMACRRAVLKVAVYEKTVQLSE